MSNPQTLTPGPPPDGVFASVFPSAIKPPSHRRKFEPKPENTIPTIYHTLKTHLQQLLGIGDERYVYVDGRRLPGHEKFVCGGPHWIGHPPHYFHSHLGTCLSTAQIIPPTAADHAAQTAKDDLSPLWPMLPHWRSSLGPEVLTSLLAAALNDLASEFVTWSYAGTYRDGLHNHLDFWVTHVFSRIAHRVLCYIDERFIPQLPQASEVKKWGDMVVARLGALRVYELFEIIVNWDTTAPAINDLRHFTTNPATRGYLTNNFADVLQRRLLHPGASTVEILQLYISIIRSFRILDPKGVLLDRVARRVRRYLRERDDTVKVIVNGLLADTTPSENGQAPLPDPDVLSELALELQRRNANQNATDDSEFDWNNMDWLPDPVDAAPDYMKSNKNTDVIGSLITLFDTKDVFVKELQSTLADRLLKNKSDFSQEISVLEHLKLRFGDSALQGCEVMLRDVLDSRKVDQVIRRDLEKEQPWTQLDQKDGGIEIHAKILSRLFWPSMLEQSFNVPTEILNRQAGYEKGFEALKQSRKLTWMNAIGQVEVELELEDRTFSEEVLPWQAAVIHAFQDESATAQPVSKSITQLASDLAMSAMLVRSACIFWISKRILAETSPNTFTVLETLPSDPSGAASLTADLSAGAQVNTAAAAEAAALAAAKEAEEADRKQKMAMYHQFIVSMLTNQGAMPLARIAMMLGIVVPGGFPFSNEELKEFLGGMVKDGALEVGNAGVYKVAS